MNTSKHEIKLMRRERVAALRLRGLTQREIQAELAHGKRPIVNPETGEPFALGTINGDLKALSVQWLEEAAATVAEHKARLLAKAQEVERAAWGKGDLRAVLAAIKQQADLLGANAPAKVDATHGGEVVYRIVRDADVPITHDLPDRVEAVQ